MARIVDDLILLANAERPDFLDLGQVDPADLAIDALAKAKALADRQWRLDEFTDRTIVADGQRLTQALMQLAVNATQHTRPGDVIAIGTAVATTAEAPDPQSESQQERLRLWVRDTGTGIVAEDQDHIFDRFYRGTGRHETGQKSGHLAAPKPPNSATAASPWTYAPATPTSMINRSS